MPPHSAIPRPFYPELPLTTAFRGILAASPQWLTNGPEQRFPLSIAAVSCDGDDYPHEQYRQKGVEQGSASSPGFWSSRLPRGGGGGGRGGGGGGGGGGVGGGGGDLVATAEMPVDDT